MFAGSCSWEQWQCLFTEMTDQKGMRERWELLWHLSQKYFFLFHPFFQIAVRVLILNIHRRIIVVAGCPKSSLCQIIPDHLEVQKHRISQWTTNQRKSRSQKVLESQVDAAASLYGRIFSFAVCLSWVLLSLKCLEMKVNAETKHVFVLRTDVRLSFKSSKHINS